MPDVVTHATFAKEIFNKLEEGKLKSVLMKHKYIYYLGAQGPDVFYFFNLYYKNKIKGYKDLGNLLHDYHVGEFLNESFNYLKENYNEMLHSYLMGFICHHALDRNTHPYIYYMTGIYDSKNKATKKFRGNHVRLERAIDSLFLINNWNMKPHKFKICKNLFSYNIDEDVFIPFYNKVIHKVYGIDDSGKVFINSIKNHRLYTKILYDPYGIKKLFARGIDCLINRRGKIVYETLFYYHNINKSVDYLNLNHKEWKHPVDALQISTKSFLELYQTALKQGYNEIIHVNNYLENNSENLVVNNLSYSTGRPWNENNKMKHFKHIF